MPVFNGSASLHQLIERLEATLRECTGGYEIVLVNDGSADGSWRLIEELAAKHEDVRGIDLARNYGQHNALLAGIREARHPVTVTIDDDLQNPPEEIPKLLAALGGCDVVYGEPIFKQHGFMRRLATRLVVRTLGALGGETAPMVSSFRAFRTELRDGFAEYTGPDVSIDGLLIWGTERFRSVKVRHDERAHGSSNYSIRKLIRHALTMITAFSTRPLRMATTLGFFVLLFGIAVLIYVLGRLAIEQHSVPGFPFLASIISIFSGAQLFAIGVIGEYLARVHVRVMSRPSYAVRAHTGGEARRSAAGWAGNGGQPPAELLAWDTEFWGFPVARGRDRALDPESARRLADWCAAERVRCVYLLADADDAETAAAAASVGFQAVDTRLTLHREPGEEPATAPTTPATIREAQEEDREPLKRLARAAHTDTRFFFDPRFERRRAAELYARWIERGLDDPRRHVLVAELDQGPVGYVVVAEEPRAIDLIAVDPAARGQGIGAALVRAAVAERPREPMSVVTQARNVGAQRLYQSQGFRLRSAEIWYHLWT